MCVSSLVLSRQPKILKKRPKTLKNPLTPIGSGRDLHMYIYEKVIQISLSISIYIYTYELAVHYTYLCILSTFYSITPLTPISICWAPCRM